MKALENYLRMHRKRAGLTQADVAYLLGAPTSSKVSAYERFLRRPTIETALALECILAVPASALFQGIHDEVAHQVKKRARRMQRRLTGHEGNHRKTRTVTTILRSSSQDEYEYEPLP